MSADKISLIYLEKYTFEANLYSGLFAFRLHLLDAVVKCVKSCRRQNGLSTSPFKLYDVDMKSACRSTSQRGQSKMEKTTKVLENSNG